MRLGTAALGLIFVGCYSSGEGISPPLERIYFPVGLAVNQELTRLYVASSDFDLQFNAGSVQSLDLERVRPLVPRECDDDGDCMAEGEVCDSGGESPSHFCVPSVGRYKGDPCGPFGGQSAGLRFRVPGPCGYVDLEHPQDDPKNATKGPILVDSVQIGAFATDVQLRYGGIDGHSGRLFIPVRGEASLNWIDIGENGKMNCGNTAESKVCDSEHRVGTDASDNSRGERMPAEPFGLAVSDEGDAIVITHQSTGKVSLFHQDVKHWGTAGGASKANLGPELSFVQSNLPQNPVGVAAAPAPLIAREVRREWLLSTAAATGSTADPYPPGFLVTFRTAPQIDLLRYYADSNSSPIRPYLQLAGTVGVTPNSYNTDSRGIAFDDTERTACEQACGSSEDAVDDSAKASRKACLVECARMPIGVYVANRSPATLLVGHTTRDTFATPNQDLPRFDDSIPIPTGPSRVYIGKVVGEDGLLETRVFVVCFDQRRIAVYDPRRRRIESFITTGRGPHAMAFDFAPGNAATGEPARALAYVAHFTDSYVGVVQLDRRKFRTYASVVLNLGPATAPRASK